MFDNGSNYRYVGVTSVFSFRLSSMVHRTKGEERFAGATCFIVIFAIRCYDQHSFEEIDGWSLACACSCDTFWKNKASVNRFRFVIR